MSRAWLLGAWVAGLGLLAGLLILQDWTVLGPLLTGVGWGMFWICLWHLAPMLADTFAFRVLLPPSHRPRLPRLLLMRWLGESVNALLPVVQVGGDLLRARLVYAAGVPAAQAAAAIVLDLTLSVATLALFILGGILLAGAALGGPGAGAPAVGALLLGAGALTGFVLLQRTGALARLLRHLSTRLAGPFWAGLAAAADAFDAALTGLYRDRRALLGSSAWALLAWLLGAGEVWLALYFLGHPVSLLDALLIECLVQAVRNAAFMVPGALGVQEGALLMAGPLLGLPPETGLALALVKRLREILLGLPGLAWIWLHPGMLLRRPGPGRN